MTRFYLIRTKADLAGHYIGENDENLHTFKSESDVLDYAVDRMKNVGSRVLDIIRMDFAYNKTQCTPLEITIERGKFKLTHIVQEATKQKE